jgi:putative colanic acid biosynthesis acetyltransferase WcaF
MKKHFEKYIDNIPLRNKVIRKFWHLSSLFLFRPFAGRIFNNWRIFILRLFGAKIGQGSVVYASAIIPAPWNLKMGDISCIGPHVELHLDKISIGSKVTISQRTYLCSGSHDITKLNTPFISSPIVVEDYAWIAAEAFIMMGVTIGKGSIVGARSAVFKDVEPWTVVGGNPAKFIKKREIK